MSGEKPSAPDLEMVDRILKDSNITVAESWPGRVLDSKFKILSRFTG